LNIFNRNNENQLLSKQTGTYLKEKDRGLG